MNHGNFIIWQYSITNSHGYIIPDNKSFFDDIFFQQLPPWFKTHPWFFGTMNAIAIHHTFKKQLLYKEQPIPSSNNAVLINSQCAIRRDYNKVKGILWIERINYSICDSQRNSCFYSAI